jgi:hypothetical protein
MFICAVVLPAIPGLRPTLRPLQGINKVEDPPLPLLKHAFPYTRESKRSLGSVLMHREHVKLSYQLYGRWHMVCFKSVDILPLKCCTELSCSGCGYHRRSS